MTTKYPKLVIKYQLAMKYDKMAMKYNTYKLIINYQMVMKYKKMSRKYQMATEYVN
jgi:hypothetical protein